MVRGQKSLRENAKQNQRRVGIDRLYQQTEKKMNNLVSEVICLRDKKSGLIARSKQNIKKETN